ncbi:MAG: hypothetical protein CMJ24_06530 [Phycisphaerae bacterium]|nr:hypothetical protein [Phycisphaerae bacterium]
MACAGTSAVWADELCIEPENMIDCSDNWFFTYNASTFKMENGCPIGAPRGELTIQDQAVWDKLVSFGPSASMTIFAQDTGVHVGTPPPPAQVTIENPVLVVTVDTSDWSDLLPFRCGTDCDVPYQEEWVLRSIDVEDMSTLPTANQTPWFGAHMIEHVFKDGTVTYHIGTTLGYLDDVLNVNREELNPTSGQPGAAVYAASLAPTGVGMPWTFNSPPGFGGPDYPLPWEGGGASWWQQRYLVFIADRDAFVRPSFNPSMRETSSALDTANGKPWWNPDFLAECSSDYGSYDYPPDQNDLKPAFDTATANFHAVLGPLYDSQNTEIMPLTTYEGPEGFLQYMAEWKRESWDTPSWAPQDGSWDWTQSTQAAGFPFSGLGLTLNWTQFWPEAIEFEKGDLNNPFGATSEFIHATKGKPIYLVGILDPYQYLGKSLANQVPWCDTCIGDFNRDGVVGVLDLMLLLEHWGESTSDLGADFPLQYNMDKRSAEIDVLDLLDLLQVWGPCEWPLDWRPVDCLQP